MSQVIALPDELYRQLAAYASQRHLTPNEAVEDWVRTLPAAPTGTPPETTTAPDIEGQRALQQLATAIAADESAYGDPWEGFYGAFESPYPDLVERHDYYISHPTPADDTHDATDEGN